MFLLVFITQVLQMTLIKESFRQAIKWCLTFSVARLCHQCFHWMTFFQTFRVLSSGYERFLIQRASARDATFLLVLPSLYYPIKSHVNYLIYVYFWYFLPFNCFAVISKPNCWPLLGHHSDEQVPVVTNLSLQKHFPSMVIFWALSSEYSLLFDCIVNIRSLRNASAKENVRNTI